MIHKSKIFKIGIKYIPIKISFNKNKKKKHKLLVLKGRCTKHKNLRTSLTLIIQLCIIEKKGDTGFGTNSAIPLCVCRVQKIYIFISAYM